MAPIRETFVDCDGITVQLVCVDYDGDPHYLTVGEVPADRQPGEYIETLIAEEWALDYSFGKYYEDVGVWQYTLADGDMPVDWIITHFSNIAESEEA